MRITLMDNMDERARLHSAGAVVRHQSPFSDLPSHKNEQDLSADFIKKWVVPFYMEIASYGDDRWISAIKSIRQEITIEVCLALLGDFNWRTRLTGAYFAAVKGYDELTDIIGTHLLKSEVCCVGHIYALVLAFFRTEKSIAYMEQYLGYYLTTPALYFDQQKVMEALLYLDKENGTGHFAKHLPAWRSLEQQRKPLEQQSAAALAKLLAEQKGPEVAEELLRALPEPPEAREPHFTTQYFEDQIAILRDLHQYNHG